MIKLNPYLGFNGNCEKAFKFYERCLGGKITAMMTYAGTPMAKDMPADWHGKIVHARMTVGSDVLMGGDAPPPHFQEAKGMTVSLNIDEPAEAERVFAALSEKGTVQMPIQETFWARRFAMFVDQFGTPWMINCEKAA